MVTKSPVIAVIDETWQRQKCSILGLEFHLVSKQPKHFVNQHLNNYNFQSWETEDIVGDGNLFRCLSHIITGQKDKYFLYLMTHINGVWEGDIEIMAASAILKTDIFVANDDFRCRLQESLATFVGTYLGPQLRECQKIQKFESLDDYHSNSFLMIDKCSP